MDPPRRAASGLALMALAYLGFLPLLVPQGLGLFEVGVALLGVGLLLAAAGLATARSGRGLPLVGTGLVVAAAGGWVVLLTDLGAGGLFLVPHAVMALATTQGAWYAALWWLGAGTRGPREAKGLALTAWFLAFGFGLYLLLVVANGFWEALVQEVLGTLGALLAARALPEVPEPLALQAARAGAADRSALQAPVLPEDEDRRG